MFNDANGFKKIYLATGYTDLRRGIDGLTFIIRYQFQLDPHDKNTLFLFCGRRSDRIKALLWEGDGFLRIYKRLMQGLEIIARYLETFRYAGKYFPISWIIYLRTHRFSGFSDVLSTVIMTDSHL